LAHKGPTFAPPPVSSVPGMQKPNLCIRGYLRLPSQVRRELSGSAALVPVVRFITRSETASWRSASKLWNCKS